MPKQVRLRRGTTAQHAVFAGALGEVTFDTDKKTLVCHDGATLGGHPLGPEQLTTIVPTGNLVWVDPVNGNDATALRGRLSQPFQTLTAARIAAATGDTIMVLPGVYDEKNLFKSGVNWHFFNGAQIIHTAASSGAIFDDGINGTNSDIVCRITGEGEFINQSNDVLSWALVVSRSGSDVSIEARHVGATVRGCVRFTGGKARLHVRTIGSSGSATVELLSGTNFLQADEIVATGGVALTLGGGTNAVEAGTIHSTANTAVHAYGGENEVRARLIRSDGLYGVRHRFVEDPVTLRVLGARIVSTYAAASGRAVQIEGSNGLVLKDCVLVSSSAAGESIYATAPATVRLYGSTMANKSEDANVTFLTGGSRFEVDAAVD